jgi:hypothetical protein
MKKKKLIMRFLRSQKRSIYMRTAMLRKRKLKQLKK